MSCAPDHLAISSDSHLRTGPTCWSASQDPPSVFCHFHLRYQPPPPPPAFSVRWPSSASSARECRKVARCHHYKRRDHHHGHYHTLVLEDSSVRVNDREGWTVWSWSRDVRISKRSAPVSVARGGVRRARDTRPGHPRAARPRRRRRGTLEARGHRPRGGKAKGLLRSSRMPPLPRRRRRRGCTRFSVSSDPLVEPLEPVIYGSSRSTDRRSWLQRANKCPSAVKLSCNARTRRTANFSTTHAGNRGNGGLEFRSPRGWVWSTRGRLLLEGWLV